MSRLAPSFLPPLVLDSSSETPLYRQIEIWFRRAILSGKLKPGQRVPSTRALAKELKVSRVPVLSAYELLIEQGYLQTFIGAGTCVSRGGPGAALRQEMASLPESAVTGPQAMRRIVSRRAMEMSGRARAWLQRVRGGANLDHFPLAIWSKLIGRHARKISRDCTGYGDAMGYEPFREAVAEYLGAFRAVRCDASQIMVTTGSQQALQIAALALLDPRDTAWIEEPSYPGIQQALKLAGARLVPVPVDAEGLRVEYGIARAQQARAAFVTPSHQFPLGVAMSVTRRRELLDWACGSGAWIIEDDYGSEFRFNGRPIASLQGSDPCSRVIYVGTLTNAMFPALRLGFMVIPRDLVRSFIDIRGAADTLATSMLHQMAMTDFIREGHFSRYITRMRAVYMERRSSLVAAIRAHVGGALEVVGDDAGMHLVALLPPGTSDVQIATRFTGSSATVYPLSECYVRPPKRGGLIVGYASLNISEIPAMLSVLNTGIREAA